MDTNLQHLIELARKYQMTPEEEDRQVRSFAFGNTHFENQAITKADIDKAADSLRSEEYRGEFSNRP